MYALFLPQSPFQPNPSLRCGLLTHWLSKPVLLQSVLSTLFCNLYIIFKFPLKKKSLELEDITFCEISQTHRQALLRMCSLSYMEVKKKSRG